MQAEHIHKKRRVFLFSLLFWPEVWAVRNLSARCHERSHLLPLFPTMASLARAARLLPTVARGAARPAVLPAATQKRFLNIHEYQSSALMAEMGEFGCEVISPVVSFSARVFYCVVSFFN